MLGRGGVGRGVPLLLLLLILLRRMRLLLEAATLGKATAHSSGGDVCLPPEPGPPPPLASRDCPRVHATQGLRRPDTAVGDGIRRHERAEGQAHWPRSHGVQSLAVGAESSCVPPRTGRPCHPSGRGGKRQRASSGSSLRFLAAGMGERRTRLVSRGQGARGHVVEGPHATDLVGVM